MAVDPSVTAALEAAVSGDPENVPLRVHLAELLMQSGHPAQALKHASAALERQPDYLAALVLAAAAARDLGDGDRATSYQRLADALNRAASSPAVSSGEQAPAAIAAGGPVPDTADELLETWLASSPPAEPEVGSLSAPTITLADVGGMEPVKRRLDLSFLSPMQNPSMRETFGKSLRGGLLLWGPPGCGKTYIARALAGELGARFYEVGLSDVLDMWIGSSERNISKVFDIAREHAPCLLFFDEIDALGHKRSQLRGGGVAMRGVVNQLLSELDGALTDNEGVFVLAATNHPWDVDTALLRPGRFDRTCLVVPPDRDARRAILELRLRNRPTRGVDLNKIAASTEGRSGADLALICEHAIERAMEASIASGEIRPITQADLMDGVSQTRGSVQAWLEHARNFVQFGNETGAYDELADYLAKRRR
jgi:SpoVK/Ycf46/Vps4 family AAA+-type ATPase